MSIGVSRKQPPNSASGWPGKKLKSLDRLDQGNSPSVNSTKKGRMTFNWVSNQSSVHTQKRNFYPLQITAVEWSKGRLKIVTYPEPIRDSIGMRLVRSNIYWSIWDISNTMWPNCRIESEIMMVRVSAGKSPDHLTKISNDPWTFLP